MPREKLLDVTIIPGDFGWKLHRPTLPIGIEDSRVGRVSFHEDMASGEFNIEIGHFTPNSDSISKFIIVFNKDGVWLERS